MAKKGVAQLDCCSGGTITVVDLSGRAVRSVRASGPGLFALENDGLPAGMYCVVLRSATGVHADTFALIR